MEVPITEVTNTDVPVIRVEDWEEDPPLALKYICGENELDLETVYAKIKRMTVHPGRGRLEVYLEAGIRKLRVKECDSSFTDTFWECMANLLDYFADFLTNDTTAMQNVWFHLLDVLQEAADLPHAFSQPQSPSCTHAQEFTQFYEQSIEIINTIITTKILRAAGALAHLNDSLASVGGGRLGAFKAGLTPWQQFLYLGSPGFDVPAKERVYSKSGNAPTTTDLELFVPSGALAIIQTHTERARALVAKQSQAVNMLAEFDQASLKISEESFIYTSTDGREHLVQAMYPSDSSRSPWKKPGLADPARIYHRPDLNMIDECIGDLKGSRAFVGPAGEDHFQMWHVSSMHSSIRRNWDQEFKSNGHVHRNMFDEWYPLTGGSGMQ